MDNNTIFSTVGGGLGVLSFVIYLIDKLKHSRLRSKCCGRNMEIRMDLSSSNSLSDEEKFIEDEYIILGDP